MPTPLISLVSILALYYIYLLSRHVGLGLISLLGAELFQIAFGPSSRLLGGIHLDPLDAVSLCLLAAGAIRTIQALRTVNSTRVLAVGYVLLFVISLVRGFYSSGILEPANESRSFVGPLIATLYFVTAPSDTASVRKYALSYLWFGGALCLVAVLAGAGLPLGMNAWDDSASATVDGRYLPATGAAALALCGFISLGWAGWRKRGLIGKLLPVVYITAAIYLRHRTVWVMILAGALALLPLDGRLFRYLLPTAFIAGTLVAVLAFYGSTVKGLADTSQFTKSATSSQTWQWRLNGWKELLFDEQQSALTVTIGKSMGTGYQRIDPVSYQIVSVAPHSEYVKEYLRVGIVGTLLIVLFVAKPAVNLWRLTRLDPSSAYPSTSTWAIVIIISLVYGITYGIDSHTYALLGIANAINLGLRVPRVEVEELNDFNEEWKTAPVSGLEA